MAYSLIRNSSCCRVCVAVLQGPITRLLVSCRALAPSSLKLGLFCCLAGTHTLHPAGAWGVGHWQHFLLLLHAAKQLMGGLWKGVLRDWATVGGALLPLQCVLDLLGNVYNANSLGALEQQAAVLGSRQLLLDAMQLERQQELSGPDGGASSSSSSSRAVSAAGASGSGSGGAGGVWRQGNVSGALQELVVDGPLGPGSTVNFDDLLVMVMMQYDAGKRAACNVTGSSITAWVAPVPVLLLPLHSPCAGCSSTHQLSKPKC